MRVKEIPNLRDVEVDVHQPSDLLHKQIVSICSGLLEHWNGVTVSQCQFASVTGGISNLCIRVSPQPDLNLAPVAVKVFGDKTELLVDRNRERLILQDLNAANIGAKVLGTFANGRIEEYLQCQTMTPQQMCSKEFIPRIAKMLRRLHDLDVSLPREDTLFTVIHSWMKLARALIFQDEAKKSTFGRLDLLKMEAEIAELEALCSAFHSPLKFTHNDLLSGNILFLIEAADAPSPDSPMQLIDFEYSAFGPRGFDFGNHFNEYAGFECDYTRYPDDQKQKLFFRHYLEEGGDAINEEELDRMVVEANLFALVSHVYWGVWALVQARYSPIDFDYLGYSALRWGEYYTRKDEFVAAARHVVGDAAIS